MADFRTLGVGLVLVIVNLLLWLPDSVSLQRNQRNLVESSIKQSVDGNVDLLEELAKTAAVVTNATSSSTALPPVDAPVSPAPVLIIGGRYVQPLGSIPMDGRTGMYPDSPPPGFHTVPKSYQVQFGVYKIPWVLQKATTALAEWYHCVRTLYYLRGLRTPDGQLVSPCVGQMKDLAALPPPKLSVCDPATTSEPCVDEYIRIPQGQCGHSHLGCINDSLADNRWNTWFQQTFLPAFAVYSRKSLRAGEEVSDADVKNKGYHIVTTCQHVLLSSAPWCGLRTSEFNDWLLDIERGLPPGRVTPYRLVSEQKRKSYLAQAALVKESVLPSALEPLSPENTSLVPLIGKEVQESSTKGPLITRRHALRQAVKVLRGVSKIGQLNALDTEAITRLKWRPWPGQPQTPDFTPVTPGPISGFFSEPSANDSGVPEIFTHADFPAETLDESPVGGSIFLPRVQTRYPVIVALRRDDPRIQTGKRPTRDSMYDVNGRVIGYHVCIVGAMRNFSNTVRQIRRRYLDTMKPQRIHLVTNDANARDIFPNNDPSLSNETKLAIARSKLFHQYAAIVPFAATFLAVPTSITKKNECVHCRGAFMKEVARMSLLSDLQRNYPVEIVFVFRPDTYPLLPLYLIPFMPSHKGLHVQGASMGHWPTDLPPEKYTAGAAPATAESSLERPEDADVIQYRLHSVEYPYTIVRDRGFVPTMFAYIADINVTKYTAAFHTRVSLGLDFGWTGDPILFGHWHVVDHWLTHFSTTMGSATDLWEEKQPGEKHQYRFYARYMAPLFKLGVEAGVLTHALDMHIFDFMFSLYRQSAAINYNLFALPVNFAAYQEMTIIRDFPTKYSEAQCKHYKFIFDGRTSNLTHEYGKNALLSWNGAIGRVVHTTIPMDACLRAPSPPGLPTCYPPFVRVPLSSRNAFRAPCAPFCGHANLLAVEGICLWTGKTGKHPRTFGKPGQATYSESPMSRSMIEGEVQRFNIVFPQSVRRRKIDDLLP